ncbi:MAG: trypsin-like peptidase domain-containing protein [Spirochaetales bacterium]|nr:trypsin-like peptidase domain-containing protein [Spirochaetales bacterium]
MKLFSRRQVLIYSIGSAAAAFIFAVILGLIFVPPMIENAKAGNEPVVEDRIPVSERVDAENGTVTLVSNNGFSMAENENIEVYKKYNSAVVNITSITFGYNWFLEPVPQERGSGSGSIIDQEGHVLTNYHVVQDADRLSITLADGSEYEGEIKGIDPENDMAVIKFDPKGKVLTTIPFGTSATLSVGQKVLAIGNPFGLQRTMTQGIISALGRPIRTSDNLIIKETIQTDAPINPGNSGGPLLNSHGEMIGINTMIYSPSGGSVGIGFAIPVDTANRIIPDMIKYGKVNRGWIEIVPVQIFPALVRYARLPIDKGILVSQTVSGGNAERAGIRGGNRADAVRYGRSIIYLGGDVIVEIDGTPINSLSDLYGALEDNKPGENVTVKVLRGNSTKTVSVKLADRPSRYQW